MLELHQFPPNKLTINFSPYCLKLETYFKLKGVAYVNKYSIDLKRNPKKKMPYIVRGNDVLGDSQIIIEMLEQESSDKMDRFLSSNDFARSHALRRMIEEGLVPCVAYFRWISPTYRDAFYDIVFRKMPPLLRTILKPRIAANVKKILWANGIARHSEEEITAFAVKDLQAVENLLPDKGWFHGEHPSVVDCSLFAVLTNVIHCPTNNPITQFSQTLPKVKAYEKFVREKVFPMKDQ